MTLMERIANFTTEQKEKFIMITDLDALDSFAAEYGIELSNEDREKSKEYFENQRILLDDEELDAATGGGRGGAINPPGYISLKDAEKQALADYRRINMEEENVVCNCNHAGYTWARNCYWEGKTKKEFSDLKCYYCGATAAKRTYSFLWW